MRAKRNVSERAFTLIELLIVIAIVLILIAIALPNFLEAQERARVARAKAQLRTLETAVHEHIIDWGFIYSDFNDTWVATTVTRNKRRGQEQPCGVRGAPVPITTSLTFNFRYSKGDYYAPNIHCPLTTPIKYIDGHSMSDPWGDGSIPVGMDSRQVNPLAFPGRKLSDENGSTLAYNAFFVCGPDRNCGDWASFDGRAYSATNGTKSVGDLWMVISPVNTQYAKSEYKPLKTF